MVNETMIWLKFQLHEGFLFCLLSSKRPLHEILNPAPIDQSAVLFNQFNGMTDEVFTYKMFEAAREKITELTKKNLSIEDIEMIIGFTEGRLFGKAKEWSTFPGVKWKMLNINKLKESNQDKAKYLVSLVRDLFE